MNVTIGVIIANREESYFNKYYFLKEKTKGNGSVWRLKGLKFRRPITDIRLSII